MIPEQEDIISPITEEDKPKRTSVHGKDLLIGMAILWGVELLLAVSLILWGGKPCVG
jgi:hypothetical protein